MARNWQVYPKEAELAENLSRELKISPPVAQLLINRNLRSVSDARAFINGADGLESPFLMKGVREAIEIIKPEISAGKRILIFGDYDVDGITSTVILLLGLRRLGGKTSYYIPHRLEEGYGLSTEGIQLAKEQGIDIIITADCGTSNIEEVRLAKELGMKVIVTDHHRVPEEHADADVLINCKHPECSSPFKDLSGAGVALKLIQALYEDSGRDDWREFLDLCALGTVGDVVSLTGENRIIVKMGLEILNKAPRPGIKALAEAAGIGSKPVTSENISYILAPRLNAVGRLDRADLSVELLLSKDPQDASLKASRLNELNQKRQKLEQDIMKKCSALIQENKNFDSEPVIFLYGHGWHQGVLGIVASRLCEQYGKPSFLMGIQDGVGKGSARSGENFDIFNALDNCKDCLLHFGGHRLAGGFSAEEERIDELKEKLIRISPSVFTGDETPIKVDAEIELSELSLELVREIEAFAPFGSGNERPLFVTRDVEIKGAKLVGSSEQHLKLYIKKDGVERDAIGFRKSELNPYIHPGEFTYDILYRLEKNSWNGLPSVEILLQEIDLPQEEPQAILFAPHKVFPDLEGEDKREEEFIDSPFGEEWILVDARKVSDKIKYLERIREHSVPAVVFVRGIKQARRIEAHLKEQGLRIIPYGKTESVSAEVSDIILLYPPPSLSHFEIPLYRSPSLKRVHLLFGFKEMRFEEKFYDSIEPDRERLARIYSFLKSTEDPDGFVNADPAGVAEKINREEIKPATVEIALAIFQEMGLLEQGIDKSLNIYKIVRDVKGDL
ncbi:MAG: single-stranded-DNA-specific exonuclease RecJ, partial [Firmicutes bacterium]|nr:single-stranded-DNA-specific exonuclease RecJ [Bacillota bacterium]